MKRIVAILAVALCCGAAGPIPLSKPMEGPAMVLSWGSDSCGKYVQAGDQEKQMYLSWTLGFISGQNTQDIGPGRMVGHGWDQAGVLVWLNNYCTANPLTEFVSAATHLRIALANKN